MKNAFRHFFMAIKRYPKNFLICILFVLLLSILGSVVPFSLKYFLDYVIVDFNAVSIALFVLALIAYSFLLIGIKILWYRSLDNFGGIYIQDTLVECEKNIVNSMDFYDIENEKNAKMKHTLFVDLFNTFTTIGHHLPSIVGSFFIVASLLIWSIFINWTLSIILLVSFIIGILISYISKNQIFKSSKATNITLKKINSLTNEFIDGVEIIKTNNIYQFYEDRTKKSISQFIDVAKKEDTKTYFWAGIADGYNSLILYLVSILLVAPIFDGSITNLALYSIVCTMVLNESQKIENNLRLVMKSEVCFKNIDNYLCMSNVVKTKVDKIDSIDFIKYGISFGENKIIEGLDAHFKSGTINMFKGDNGTGKTTLIRSLMGVYSKYDGKILINQSIDKADIKEKTVYISQNEGLIGDNILEYFKIITGKGIDLEKIQNLITELGLENDFLKKQIINCGDNLSNGEKKKIQLIRLMLMKDRCDLFLLDEISAGLDANTKNKYYDLIRNLKNNSKIVIMIEHDENIDIQFDTVVQLYK